MANLSSAPPSGMRDFVPHEAALRDWATSVILRTYESFGFTRIETPALENIALLRRGEGGENLALIFEVLKRGEKLDQELSSGAVKKEDLADLGLRFDLTVPLVRFYSANQSSLPNPMKAIQVGSVWRAESPQAGRFRQFTQCDIDIFGMKSEMAEIELMQATAHALLELNFTDFTVRVNDRRILSEIARSCGFAPDSFETVFIALDKLDKIGVKGVEAELKKNGHADQAVSKMVALLNEFGSEGGKEPLQAVRELVGVGVEANGESQIEPVFAALERTVAVGNGQSRGKYKVQFDPTLVRGMGYYTGQIFEISNPGYSYSIAGGGRYDKMVGKFSGRDVPACGFSLGFERIITILTDKGFKAPVAAEKVAVIYDPDRDDLAKVVAQSQRVRDRGLIVSLLPRKKEMRKQLDSLVVGGFTSYAMFRNDADQLDLKELNQSPS